MKHLVVVEWMDSATADGWQHEADAEKHQPSVCKTVGWLLTKNRQYITVAASQSDSGNWSQAMSIPRACVTSIRRLE